MPEPLSVAEAQAELKLRKAANGGHLTTADIREVVSRTDVGNGAGKTTVLWSGRDTFAPGDGIGTEEASRALASQSENVRIIQDTEARKLLEPDLSEVNPGDLNVKQELLEALKAETGNPDLTFESPEFKEAWSGNNKTSLWGGVSDRFAETASGDVVTLTGFDNPNGSIYSEVELPKLLGNPAVTTINGIPRVELLADVEASIRIRLGSNADTAIDALRSGDLESLPYAIQQEVRGAINENAKIRVDTFSILARQQGASIIETPDGHRVIIYNKKFFSSLNIQKPAGLFLDDLVLDIDANGNSRLLAGPSSRAAFRELFDKSDTIAALLIVIVGASLLELAKKSLGDEQLTIENLKDLLANSNLDLGDEFFGQFAGDLAIDVALGAAKKLAGNVIGLIILGKEIYDNYQLLLITVDLVKTAFGDHPAVVKLEQLVARVQAVLGPYIDSGQPPTDEALAEVQQIAKEELDDEEGNQESGPSTEELLEALANQKDALAFREPTTRTVRFGANEIIITYSYETVSPEGVDTIVVVVRKIKLSGEEELSFAFGEADDLKAISYSLDDLGAIDTSSIKVSLQAALINDDIEKIKSVEGAGQVGAFFGSQLSRIVTQVAGIDNPFASVALEAGLATAVENIAEIVRAGGVTIHLNQLSDYNVLSGIEVEFADQLQNAAIGAISSYLTAELIGALGLEGFGGELASTIGNTAINQVLSNVVDIAGGAEISPFAGFNNPGQVFGNAIGSFFGSRLANTIISADTVAGQLGGSIGGSVGSIAVTHFFFEAGTTVAGNSLFGVQLGALAGPIGALVGALFGTLLGTLIGDLFGKTPQSGADLDYDPYTGEFRVGASWKRGAASKETARALASQVGETLNGVLDLIGGTVMNPAEIEPGQYGMYKSEYRYQTGYGRKAPDIRFDEAGDLVAFGTLVALENVEILGGDIYLKRALHQSLENQKGGAKTMIGGVVSTAFRPATYDSDPLNDLELEILLGDLSVAQDYAAYLDNAPIVNALIAASPDSAFAAGWIITLQRAYELGLHRRHESDWYGGWGYMLGEEEAVLGSLEVSYDGTTGERLISFDNRDGEAVVLGDTIATAGKDRVDGTSGADVIVIDGATVAAGLTVNGETTTEAFEIDVAAEIHGGDGNDTIYGGDRGDDIFGDAGDDHLYGGRNADWLFGGAGNDTLDAYVSDDGNYLDGGAGNDSLIGRDGSDWLVGGDGQDTLDGGGGDDLLEGGAGAGDVVRGGRGDDVYFYRIGDGADALADEGIAQGTPDRPNETVTVALRYGPQTFKRFQAFNGGYLREVWHISPDQLDGSVSTARGRAQGGEDKLVFGEGVSIENLRMRRDADGAGVADDLIIEILDETGTPTGDAIRLADWFDPFNRIEWLEFADGQGFRIGDFASFSIGTEGDDIIIGSDGRDFIHGGAGNDIIHLLLGDDVGNGGLGDDFVSGDGGDDIVIGGNDNDKVLGGSGRDIVSGDLGDDEVFGDEGDDTIAGGLGDDLLVGGEGDDLIRFNRGDGRDTLFDAYSAAGWALVYDGASGWVSGVTMPTVDHDSDPTTGLVTQVHFNGAVLFDGEAWAGPYRFDTATSQLWWHATEEVADVGVDTLEFAIGIDIEDLVFRLDGDDLIIGVFGPLDDTAPFAGLTDSIRLKDWSLVRGIERFAFFNTGFIDIDALATMRGGTDGDDAIDGGSSRDWLTGGAGNDSISGLDGNDLLVGHGGGDVLKGGAGDDTLLGGSGDDTLDGGVGADKLVGGEGFDIASYASATAGVTVELINQSDFQGAPAGDVFSSIEGLEGSAFNDTLIGDDESNELIGGAGADRLEGRAGDDVYVIAAGHGDDVISDRGVDMSSVIVERVRNEFGAVLAPFTESFVLTDTRDEGFGTIYEYTWTVRQSSTNEVAYQQVLTSFTVLSSAPQVFNNLYWTNGFAPTGQGYEVVRKTGSPTIFDGGVDAISWDTGESLSNLVFTFDGADLVIAGADGAVRIEGFFNANSQIEEFSLADGLTANLDRLYFSAAGSASADFVVGDTSANSLTLGDGDDVGSGGGGDDTLYGGAGDDVLEGGAGADLLDGGDGVDEIRYLGSASGVTVNLLSGAGSGGEAAGDSFVSIENVRGSNYADSITGDGGDNRLFGYDGDDMLSGGGGDDVLQGGNGADAINGGAGDDEIDGGAGADQLSGEDGVDHILGGDGADSLFGGAGNDLLVGEAGNDVLDGGADDDQLAGGDGADTLKGGAGDDVLIGGAGADRLEGGDGADMYLFDAASGFDVVVDADGPNTIVLEGADRNRIRFDRSGDDLIIRILGSASAVTLQDYYAGAGAAMHSVLAGGYTLYFGHAQGFFDLFDDLPGGATTLNAVIDGELDRYWHLNGNARPEGYDQAIATAEDTPIAGALAVVDHDDNIAGFELSGGPAHGAVTVDPATGAYVYAPEENFFGEDAFYIDIVDSQGNRTDVLISVTVTPVNDAPSDVQFAGVNVIDENAGDFILGGLAVIDVDGAPNEHTLSVDDARFEIVDNELRLRPGVSLDHESEPTVAVTVTATDAGGLSNPGSVYVFDVADVNEAPVASPGAFTVDENVSVGAAVGAMIASDPDDGAFGDLRYYIQTSGGSASSVSDDGLFEIDALTGALSVAGAIDFEAASVHSLAIIVRDNAGAPGFLETIVAVEIAVGNINEAPTDIDVDTLAVSENLDGAVIGAVSGVDPDGLDIPAFSALSFSVSDARFEVDALGRLKLKAGVSLDFEVEPSLDLTITATDDNGAGLSYSETFTISVLDEIDLLFGGPAGDVINGAAGADHLFGYAGADHLSGHGGNDLLDGGIGADTLEGGEGDDVVYGREGADLIHGGAGADTLYGGSEDAAGDVIYGGEGDDEIHGSQGDDTFYGGAGADAFYGEGGLLDLVSYAEAASGVVVDLGAPSNNAGEAAGDTFTDIHAIAGSAFDDTMIGAVGNDRFDGAGGADSLVGGSGNDYLAGGDAADTLIGGAGHDTLLGGAGDDLLDAGDGNDILDGGAGSDTLIGGLDEDKYLVSRTSGSDVIRNYDPSGAGDTISFADDIAYDELWFSRSGDDLVITVVGAGAEARIEDWYASPLAGDPANVFKLELFLAGDREAIGVDAEDLVDAMAAYAVPVDQNALDAALSEIGGVVDELWGFSTPPTIEDISDLSIDEDGVVTFSVRIYDDKVAHELLSLGVLSDNTDLIDAGDVTFGAPDSNGVRQVEIRPKLNQSGTATLTLQAADGGSGAAQKTFSLTVNPVADAPQLVVGDASGNEGAAIAVNIQAALVDDDGSETLSIEIPDLPAGVSLNKGVYDSGAQKWILTPEDLTGLTLTAPADGGGTDFTFTVNAVATDAGGTETTSETINVQINATPSDLVFIGVIDENAANGVVVGDASHVDPDAGGTYVYSLADNAGGRFSINAATGVVSVLNGGALNFENNASHSIAIRVTDQGGLYREEIFTVAVNDINEPFAFADKTVSVAENSAIGDDVGFHTGADPDGGQFGSLRYYFEITSGVSQVSADGLFAIDALTGLVEVNGALDFESAAVHTYNVVARDNAAAPGYNERIETLTINITNVNEAPSDIVPTGAMSVSEAASNGTAVADFNHVDPEGGTMTYSLSNSAGGRFAINATTGVLTVANAALLNYEAAQSHAISVRVADPGGLWRDENFTISVTDINEAPALTDVAASEHSSETSTNVFAIAETSANQNWNVAYLSSTDPEGSPRTYYFKNGASYTTVSPDSRFWIDGGAIRVNQANLSYETHTSGLNYQIVAKDPEGLYSAPVGITINITDVNEAPTVNNSTFSPAETWNPTVPIGTLSFSDPDLPSTSNGQLAFSITGGNTGNKFWISSSGQLMLNSALDYENAAQRNFTLTIQARDRNGTGLSDTATVTVNVQDVNEAPVVNSVNYVGEYHWKWDATQTSAQINASDPEGQALSYSIVGGTGDWQRTTVNANGLVKMPISAYTSYYASVNVRVLDSLGAYSTVTVHVEYESMGGGEFPPIVLDLDGDGVELLRLVESDVWFDVDSDGTLEQVGWAAPDDGILTLDRNGDGVINDGSEVSFLNDVDGATSDLEGLAAFDTNENGFLDAADERWAEFYVWRDANSDGVSQTGELFTLDQLGVAALSLARTLTDNGAPEGEHYENIITATSEYILTDGTVRETADVAFGYYDPDDADFGAPVVLDLDGDGLELVGAGGSDVYFDMSGDGLRDRTGWVRGDDGILALDRDGDGAVTSIDEISFINDLPGATTDLEGLRAFDSNNDGRLDAADGRFGEFLVWRDENQDGVSQEKELVSLLDAGVLSIDLNGQSTGAGVEGALDNVILNLASFTTDRGRTNLVGDIAFRYVRSRDADGPSGAAATFTGGDETDRTAPASGVDDCGSASSGSLDFDSLFPLRGYDSILDWKYSRRSASGRPMREGSREETNPDGALRGASSRAVSGGALDGVESAGQSERAAMSKFHRLFDELTTALFETGSDPFGAAAGRRRFVQAAIGDTHTASDEDRRLSQFVQAMAYSDRDGREGLGRLSHHDDPSWDQFLLDSRPTWRVAPPT